MLKKKFNKKKIKKNWKKKTNQEIFQKINKKQFIFKQKVSNKGHLFSKIHKRDIAKFFNLNEKNIFLKKEIKEIGEYEIKIKIGELFALIYLVVQEE